MDESTEPDTSSPKFEAVSKPQELKEQINKSFQCSLCIFRELYEYFGRNPSQTDKYILNEDCYLIEDPFYPPKQGKFIILGAHCMKCKKSVCKDINCSIYFDGTYCIQCAKAQVDIFPVSVQEKIKKIKSYMN